MQFTTLQTWVFAFIALLVFVDGSAEYFILPTAWQYLRSLGQTEAFLGIVLASFNISCIVCNPTFGWLHDRFGCTKFIVVLSYFLKFLGYLVYSIPISPYLPLVGLILSGMGSGCDAVNFSIAVAHTPQTYRAQAFLVFDGLFVAGATVGPAVSSFLTFDINIFGWHIDSGNSPSFILALIYLVLFFLALRLPNELEKPDNTSKEILDLDELRRPSEVRYASRSTTFCVLYQMFITTFLFSLRLFYVPLFAQQRFHLRLLLVKLFFWINTLVVLLAEISGYLLAGYMSESVISCMSFPSQILVTAGVFLLAMTWQQLWIKYAYILLGICITGAPLFVLFPVLASLISKITDPSQISFYQGLCLSVVHVGFLSAKLISGFLFDQTSLLYYSLVIGLLLAAGIVWTIVEYKNMSKKYT